MRQAAVRDKVEQNVVKSKSCIFIISIDKNYRNSATSWFCYSKMGLIPHDDEFTGLYGG
jgi:hypothetical protein